MFDLDRCRAGRHLAPKPDRSQVFNKSHIQLVSSFRLTCSMPTLSVSFIPLFFCRGRGLGWVAPVRCQGILNDVDFPGGLLGITSRRVSSILHSYISVQIALPCPPYTSVFYI